MPEFLYQNGLLPEFKELDAAIEQGNLAKVKELINDKNINAVIDNQEFLPPIIAAAAHGQYDIVQFLLEQKCQIDKESKTKCSALISALFLYSKHQSIQHQKIALLLLEHNANVLIPSMTIPLSSLKADDVLKTLIVKLRSVAESKDDSTKAVTENEIGLIYQNLGDMSTAKKWYHTAAQKKEPYAMWNLAIQLKKENKYQEAFNLLAESYALHKIEKSRSDTLAQLEEITNFNISPQEKIENYIKLANIYLQKENGDQAQEYLLKAYVLNKQCNLYAFGSATHQCLEAAFILSDDKGEIPKKRFYNENELPDHFLAMQLLQQSAQAGLSIALHYLAYSSIKRKNIVATCLLSTLSDLPVSLKKDIDQINIQQQQFILGLKALYGIDRKNNAFEAIKTFERLSTKEEKDRPDNVAENYLHIAMGNFRLARNMSDQTQKSERIHRAIQAHDQVLKLYSQSKFFPISDIFDQLFKLITLTSQDNDKVALIKTILAYYQTELHCENASIASFQSIFAALQKIELFTLQADIWKTLIDTLNASHQQTNKSSLRDLLIEQLQILAKISENLPAKFQFFVNKALADCYNRNDNKATLQKAIQHYELTEKLASPAEEKFDLKTYRETFRRFADVVQHSSGDDAISAYQKAAELGDVESSLRAAAVAEQDEKQLNTAIQSYAKAMQDALHENHEKNIILALKNTLTFKNKMDLSSQESERIDAIIFSTQKKLLDKIFVQQHLDDLSEIYKVALQSYPKEKIDPLFIHCLALIQEKNAIEQEKKQELELIDQVNKITKGTSVIANLIITYQNTSGIQNAKEIIKKNLIQYMSDSIAKNEVALLDLNNLKINTSESLQVTSFKQEILNQLVELLKQHPQLNAKRILIELYILQTQYMPTSDDRTKVIINLIEQCKKMSLHQQLASTEKTRYIRKLTKIVEHKENSQVLEHASNALQTYRYHQDHKKLQMRQFAQQNYLPAVYDIFEKYKKPRFYGKPHIRRPLYLAAKILLLSTDRKKAEKRFDLPKPKIELMQAEAIQLLKQWSNRNLQEIKDTAEEYQYCQQAKWYSEVIEKAGTEYIIDADKYILRATMAEHRLYNMSQVQIHVLEGMKQALKVSNQWIQQKFDEIDSIQTTENLATNEKQDETNVKADAAPFIPQVVLQYAPSAPPQEPISPKINVASTPIRNSSLYPVLFSPKADTSVTMPMHSVIEPELKEQEINKEAVPMTLFKKTVVSTQNKQVPVAEKRKEVLLA